ncbi:hypothetical protein [Methylobacterium nodulans]|uniref:Cytochrome c oxidase subunit IIa n=1 Tax=Methylobacterium nodulans (strain LMG 21967 / CNCM I-2342 / ORS 2060) TaxID=460265 RepID=B8IX57_METNO|nr:hypothetical protein [Methylobacterium nodulans]ACL63098.1 conserved hypothetical protein [Methylobacterium nodulans ORS 2060]
MLNSPPLQDRDEDTEHRDVAAIIRAGPSGALTLAAIATAIVVTCWFAFYLFVFLPRGS